MEKEWEEMGAEEGGTGGDKRGMRGEEKRRKGKDKKERERHKPNHIAKMQLSLIHI